MRVRDVLAGKMVLLNKLLDKLHKGGHRVLIFSQVRRLHSATARSRQLARTPPPPALPAVSS
jgi:hypothetical protein